MTGISVRLFQSQKMTSYVNTRTPNATRRTFISMGSVFSRVFSYGGGAKLKKERRIRQYWSRVSGVNRDKGL